MYNSVFFLKMFNHAVKSKYFNFDITVLSSVSTVVINTYYDLIAYQST